MKKPVLTIAMLCSGRPETEKSLKSLEELRRAVPCELILTDTGCDKEQREMLERYADKLLSFSWCNDFSMARNVSLEEAEGEWYLYLDDDEWFEDCRELIAFFRTGEYKKYSCASYIQRNYMTQNGKIYTDARVLRMTCLKNSPRFRSCIHEYLHPVGEPQKYLDSRVAHYGYYYSSEEEQMRHSERNISLLMEMLKRERHEIRWWGQLVQEYVGAKKYEEMEKICREGLLEFEKEDEEYYNIHRGGLYCGIVEAKRLSGHWEEALVDCKKALQDKRIGRKSQGRLYGLGTQLCYKAGEYELGADYGRKYVKLYQEWEKKGSLWRELETFSARVAFEPADRSYAYCYGILNELKTGGGVLLHKNIKSIDWSLLSDYGALTTLSELIGVTAECGEYSYMKDFFGMFIEKGFSLYRDMDTEKASKGTKEVCTAYYEEAEALQKMLSAEEADDWDVFGEAVKEALGVFPQFQDALKAYAELYAERRLGAVSHAAKVHGTGAERENAGSKNLGAGEQEASMDISPEMRALAEQIKAQLPILLSQGMKEQALQIIGRLKTMVPGDEEVLELERKLQE